MKKRTAHITVETERLLVISHSRQRFQGCCDACNTEVDFIGVAEAAALIMTTQRRIFHLAETGEIHFVETVEGQALFCIRSLSNQKRLDN